MYGYMITLLLSLLVQISQVLGGGNSTNVTNTQQNVTEIREPESIFYSYNLICPVEGETTPHLSTTTTTESTTQPDERCNAGWSRLGGYCYILIPELMNRSEAETKCQNTDSQLLYLKNINQNRFVEQEILDINLSDSWTSMKYVPYIVEVLPTPEKAYSQNISIPDSFSLEVWFSMDNMTEGDTPSVLYQITDLMGDSELVVAVQKSMMLVVTKQGDLSEVSFQSQDWNALVMTYDRSNNRLTIEMNEIILLSTEPVLISVNETRIHLFDTYTYTTTSAVWEDEKRGKREIALLSVSDTNEGIIYMPCGGLPSGGSTVFQFIDMQFDDNLDCRGYYECTRGTNDCVHRQCPENTMFQASHEETTQIYRSGCDSVETAPIDCLVMKTLCAPATAILTSGQIITGHPTLLSWPGALSYCSALDATLFQGDDSQWMQIGDQTEHMIITPTYGLWLGQYDQNPEYCIKAQLDDKGEPEYTPHLCSSEDTIAYFFCEETSSEPTTPSTTLQIKSSTTTTEPSPPSTSTTSTPYSTTISTTTLSTEVATTEITDLYPFDTFTVDNAGVRYLVAFNRSIQINSEQALEMCDSFNLSFLSTHGDESLFRAILDVIPLDPIQDHRQLWSLIDPPNCRCQRLYADGEFTEQGMNCISHSRYFLCLISVTQSPTSTASALDATLTSPPTSTTTSATVSITSTQIASSSHSPTTTTTPTHTQSPTASTTTAPISITSDTSTTTTTSASAASTTSTQSLHSTDSPTTTQTASPSTTQISTAANTPTPTQTQTPTASTTTTLISTTPDRPTNTITTSASAASTTSAQSSHSTDSPTATQTASPSTTQISTTANTPTPTQTQTPTASTTTTLISTTPDRPTNTITTSASAASTTSAQSSHSTDSPTATQTASPSTTQISTTANTPTPTQTQTPTASTTTTLISTTPDTPTTTTTSASAASTTSAQSSHSTDSPITTQTASPSTTQTSTTAYAQTVTTTTQQITSSEPSTRTAASSTPHTHSTTTSPTPSAAVITTVSIGSTKSATTTHSPETTATPTKTTTMSHVPTNTVTPDEPATTTPTTVTYHSATITMTPTTKSHTATSATSTSTTGVNDSATNLQTTVSTASTISSQANTMTVAQAELTSTADISTADISTAGLAAGTQNDSTISTGTTSAAQDASTTKTLSTFVESTSTDRTADSSLSDPTTTVLTQNVHTVNSGSTYSGSISTATESANVTETTQRASTATERTSTGLSSILSFSSNSTSTKSTSTSSAVQTSTEFVRFQGTIGGILMRAYDAKQRDKRDSAAGRGNEYEYVEVLTTKDLVSSPLTHRDTGQYVYVEVVRNGKERKLRGHTNFRNSTDRSGGCVAISPTDGKWVHDDCSMLKSAVCKAPILEISTADAVVNSTDTSSSNNDEENNATIKKTADIEQPQQTTPPPLTDTPEQSLTCPMDYDLEITRYSLTGEIASIVCKERAYIPSGNQKPAKPEPVVPPKIHPAVEGPLEVAATATSFGALIFLGLIGLIVFLDGPNLVASAKMFVRNIRRRGTAIAEPINVRRQGSKSYKTREKRKRNVEKRRLQYTA